MIFVSATRLRIRSIFYLLKFMRANEGSIKQLLITRGFLGGKELIDKKLTFWTLTMWHDDVAMKSFRNSAAHKIAMQKLPYWCDEASYVHWTQEKAEIPVWGNVFKKMIADGKTTQVKKPSNNQAGKNYPKIKWTKLERKFEGYKPE